MIRAVIALFVFAVALCGWIIFGPSGRDTADVAAPDPPGSGVDVTRAAPGAEALPPAAQQALGTRTSAAQAAVTPAAPARPIGDDSDLQAMTAGVLAGLGLADTALPTAGPGGTDPLQAMTASALSGIQSVTGLPAPAPAPQPTALQDLVTRALRDGQSDAYIDTLLNEAARNGSITVPEMLVTADGRVDTHVLLASIVAEATRAATGEAPAIPDGLPDGPGVELRMVQRADETLQYRFYTVQPGDSLGAIAVRFYGSADRYDVIYGANRTTLSSPDLIRAGQRLVIPDPATL